jgi:ubiquinone biosynthesis protein UbiJ
MSARTLDAAALAALERAIGAALSMDPHTQRALAPLAGKVLRVELRVPQSEIFVLPQAGGVRLAAHHEGAVDCTVSGAASDFVALALAADKPAALVNGDLRVAGDSALLLDLEKALAGLDVDWEQRLSLVIGESAAHQLGRALRGSARLGQRARTRFEQHVEEFIHEEARLAPPRAEVEDFFSDLRALAARADRLEAGVRRLARRSRAGTGAR